MRISNFSNLFIVKNNKAFILIFLYINIYIIFILKNYKKLMTYYFRSFIQAKSQYLS